MAPGGYLGSPRRGPGNSRAQSPESAEGFSETSARPNSVSSVSSCEKVGAAPPWPPCTAAPPNERAQPPSITPGASTLRALISPREPSPTHHHNTLRPKALRNFRRLFPYCSATSVWSPEFTRAFCAEDPPKGGTPNETPCFAPVVSGVECVRVVGESISRRGVPRVQQTRTL